MSQGKVWRRRLVVAAASVGFLIVAGVLLMSSLNAEPALDLPRPVRSTQFDGANAYKYLVEICKLGPRMTGTAAMQRQQRLVRQHFEALGATVELQPFGFTQPSQGRRQFTGANLVVRWQPQAKRRVLLGAHYDTRPHADQEPVLRNQTRPFIGANDGASGVAFLMELGRLLPTLELAVGVDFVLFDAEEYVFTPSDKYFLGSEFFVQEYVAQRQKYTYDAVIVLDMIAGRNLTIYQDQRSAAKAGALLDEVWGIAQRLGIRPFHPEVKYDILDDHISFQKAGINAIDIIDFDYPHWHRLSDTPQQCSGESMELVGRVLVEWLKQRQ